MWDLSRKITVSDKPTLCNKCELKNQQYVQGVGLPPADIVVVAGAPLYVDAKMGAFASRAGAVVKSVIHSIQNDYINYGKLNVFYTYSVKCVAVKDAKKQGKGQDAKIEVINTCRSILLQELATLRPKVIIAMGTDAIKALGYPGTISSVRGIAEKRNIPGLGDVIVLPTFHPASVFTNFGLTNLFKNDIEKAYKIALLEKIPTEEFDMLLGKTYEEVMTILDTMQNEIEELTKDKDYPLIVSVDTETTSLEPWDKDSRMIAVSMSWKNNKGMAILYDHNEAKFTEEQLNNIKDKLTQIIGMPKVVVGMHNAKFDVNWLDNKLGIKIGRSKLVWDTMLAEHLLDEDKKGEYDLKTVSTDYFPYSAKYESELKEIIDSLKKQKQTERDEAKKEYETSLVETFKDKYLSMSDVERASLLEKYSTPGLSTCILKIDDAAYISTVEPKKTKTKKFATILKRLITNKNFNIREYVSEDEVPPIEEMDIVVTFEDVPVDVLLKYAAIDAIMTRKVLGKQHELFNKDNRFTAGVIKKEKELSIRSGAPVEDIPNLFYPMANILTRASLTIADMEYYGVRIDREKALQYSEKLEEHKQELLDEIFRYVGREFNVNSGPELQKLLFEEYKFEPVGYTNSGAPSVDEESINALAEKYNEPFLKKLQEYRETAKCKDTYIGNLLSGSEKDGKLHASFNLNGTATGRLSSSKPNLQNIPAYLAGLNIKSLFLPDSDDYYIIDLDISNAEMRVLTAYSKDEKLIKAFNDGMDLHCLTGSMISNFSYDELKRLKDDKTTPQYKMRQVAKKVNFGVIYGITHVGLSKQLNISEEEADDYVKKYLDAYPGVRNYIKSTESFVAKYRFAYTYFGRKRRFELLRYSSAMENRMMRQAVNFRIQSTSSDIVLTNLMDVGDMLKKLGGRLLITVHDSIVAQVPKNTIGELKKKLDACIVENTANRCPWLPVKWEYDVAYGDSYGEAHNSIP